MQGRLLSAGQHQERTKEALSSTISGLVVDPMTPTLQVGDSDRLQASVCLSIDRLYALSVKFYRLSSGATRWL